MRDPGQPTLQAQQGVADAFFRPLPLLAVAVLALNDHLLKGSGVLPGWLTGKLSDVAGMFFFPLFLSALLALVVRPPAWLAGRVEATSALLTAAIFCAVKLSPSASGAWELATGALRGGVRVHNVCDPTDLVALPLCALSVLYSKRVRRQATPTQGRSP